MVGRSDNNCAPLKIVLCEPVLGTGPALLNADFKAVVQESPETVWEVYDLG